MSPTKKTILIVVAALSIPTLLFGGYFAFVVCNTPNWRGALGTFGDSFGVINALFTGLAFSGLLITLIQQREEIALQHGELIETRKQFERSASAQEQTARLNAYTNLLEEYGSQIAILQAASDAAIARRREDLAGNRPELVAEAMMKPTPYLDQIEDLKQRRKHIIEDLEHFLKPHLPVETVSDA